MGNSAPGWHPDPAGSGRQRYFDGNTWTDQYRDTLAAPAPKKRGRVWLIVGGVIVGLIVLGSITGKGGDKTSSSNSPVTVTRTATATQSVTQPGQTETVTYTPPPPPGPARQVGGEGIFVVGTDIAPGRWRTQGGQGSCYWARLGDLNGDDILSNSNSSGPQVIQVLPTDAALQLRHCAPWYLDGP